MFAIESVQNSCKPNVVKFGMNQIFFLMPPGEFLRDEAWKLARQRRVLPILFRSQSLFQDWAKSVGALPAGIMVFTRVARGRHWGYARGRRRARRVPLAVRQGR